MTEGLYIDPASMKALEINFKKFQREVLASAQDGLKRFGMKIVARAKRIIERDKIKAFGILRNSGRTVVQADGTVDAGFFAEYAAYVEYGRKAGGMPPVDDIYAWLYKKKIMPVERKREASPLDKEIAKEKRERTRSLRSLFSRSKYKTLSKEERKRYSLAWAIALSIKENGTKAHPFLKPAYEEHRNQIDEFMRGVIEKTVENFKPKQ